MDLMPSVVERLLPRGVFGRQFLAAAKAISGAVESAYQTTRNLLRESNPGTADITLPLWIKMLAVQYDIPPDADQLRLELRQRYVASGSQTQSALEEAVQVAFPGLEVFKEAPGIGDLQYLVTGEISDEKHASRLRSIMQRFGPAEMELVFGPVEVLPPLLDTDELRVLDTDGTQILGRILINEQAN